MRVGIATITCVIVSAGVARAHGPDHAKAHLACTMDGKSVGARAILDHDVTCAIVVDDGKLIPIDAGKVSVTVALPYGSSAPIDQPAHQTGTAWAAAAAFTAGHDYLRCEVTTFAGELRAHGDVVWSGSIVIRPACARPKVSPKIACSEATASLDDDLGLVPHDSDESLGPPPEQHLVLRCTVTVAHAPKVALRAMVARPTDHGEALDIPANFELTDDGHGGVTGHGDLAPGQSRHIGERDCPPLAIAAAVWTADGAILWTGKVRAVVACR